MEILKGEKEIDKSGKLILTNKRLVKEYGRYGKKNSEEFPIEKLDSISYVKKKYWSLVIVGIIVAIVSYLGIFFLGNVPFISIFFWPGIFLGIVLAILGFIGKGGVEFRSPTMTISEYKRGMENFIENVKKEVYK